MWENEYSLVVVVACLILFLCLVFVFLACQRGVSSGEFFWNQVLFVLEDFFEFSSALDGIEKKVLRQPVASPWHFSFYFHLDVLDVEVLIFKWAALERNFKLCFVFCVVFSFRLPSFYVA